MPNQLTPAGLQIKTQTELIEEFTQVFRNIYGDDINLDADTPDGQMMRVWVQAATDTLELLQDIYSSFDPDQATGRSLDQRVGINGIQRQAGTYSITEVRVFTDRDLSLIGLDSPDATDAQIFTVADDEGNEWQLLNSVDVADNTRPDLEFRSKEIGRVQALPNTITNVSTVVLGVTRVTNMGALSTLGTDEESDFDLRIRRQASVALPSQGFIESLESSLRNIDGITFARVFENPTAAVDSDGTEPFNMWVVVDGSSEPENIATAIYNNRPPGIGMRGDQSHNIIQSDGVPFLVNWDEVSTIDIHIRFRVGRVDSEISIEEFVLIRNYLAENLNVGIGEAVTSTHVVVALGRLDPSLVVSDVQFTQSSDSNVIREFSGFGGDFPSFTEVEKTQRGVTTPRFIYPDDLSVATDG